MFELIKMNLLFFGLGRIGLPQSLVFSNSGVNVYGYDVNENLIDELKKNNLPYIVCFTDPTAGGITASFAMLGDVHFAEPGCMIAFAGKRVIQATVKEELSPDFQTAEFIENHGFVDKVVHRKDLKEQVGILLSILLKKNSDINSELTNETSENIESHTKAAS